MPYKDKEVQKQKQRELMIKKRLVNREPCEPVNPVGEPIVNPKDVNPVGEPIVNPKDVNPVSEPPLDPWDWRDRRNYSEVYLKCLDEQGGQLTEASRVALKITRSGRDYPFLYSRGEEKPIDEVKKARAKAVLASYTT